MHLQYAATSTDAGDVGQIVTEALLLTLEMLQLTDPAMISARYAQQCENRPDSPSDWQAISKFGAQWTADACQQLRNMGFHEKWIMVLGDELDQWSPYLVPASTLETSILQLATECSADATATTQALLARDQPGSSAMPNLQRFSNAACGLAIVLAMLDELDQLEATQETNEDGNLLAGRALASFGAHLIVAHQPPSESIEPSSDDLGSG